MRESCVRTFPITLFHILTLLVESGWIMHIVEDQDVGAKTVLFENCVIVSSSSCSRVVIVVLLLLVLEEDELVDYCIRLLPANAK